MYLIKDLLAKHQLARELKNLPLSRAQARGILKSAYLEGPKPKYVRWFWGLHYRWRLFCGRFYRPTEHDLKVERWYLHHFCNNDKLKGTDLKIKEGVHQ